MIENIAATWKNVPDLSIIEQGAWYRNSSMCPFWMKHKEVQNNPTVGDSAGPPADLCDPSVWMKQANQRGMLHIIPVNDEGRMNLPHHPLRRF